MAEWAIPDEILRRAPESPWGFPPRLFEHSLDPSAQPSPSDARAREALTEPGTVIDVGAGVGASSLGLAGDATAITALDQSEEMLRAFANAAEGLDVDHMEIKGTWPEAAPEAGTADVVVCHHVLYNAAEINPLVTALTRAARRRVVVEITLVHPAATLADLWIHFHGLDRPSGPTYRDALDVLEEMGIRAEVETWRRGPRKHRAPREELVAFVRRRLCLTKDRDAEIDELLGDRQVWSPQEIATMWWPGSA